MQISGWQADKLASVMENDFTLARAVFGQMNDARFRQELALKLG